MASETPTSPSSAGESAGNRELPTQYDPKAVESTISARWLKARAYAATPDERESYVVMMPLPNVTGALHMGHAMDNVMQDLLIRWHRMQGKNALWQPGTDHAGIATQSVVEKRLFELEQKTRHDIGRDALVQRIWEWKDEYQARIIQQQQGMGASCDWDRQRFTMDPVCARAVRHFFFKLFRDGLIYQGDRLVNWDCELQTAVADDETYKESVQGHFWHLRYPVIDPQPGEPDHVMVATTRPETMLGDTAVACHPDPRKQLDSEIARLTQKVADAPAKEKAAAEAELEAMQQRLESHLPGLLKIAEMAKAGRKLLLPLQEREIPLILDEWAKPELGSGCVKITPAHDPNDYEVWQRHRDAIDIINILAEDGTLNDRAGAYAKLDRFEARKRVVADLEAAGKLVEIEDRVIEIDHSDRSKTIIEPFLSKQWFVRMGDVDGGITCGAGTANQFKSPGLAQAAIDAADPSWRSATGRNVNFWPDADRYRGLFVNWLAEKRDWCISRQLWWGHRIPVWSGDFAPQQLLAVRPMLEAQIGRDDIAAWIRLPDGRSLRPNEAFDALQSADADKVTVNLCFLDQAAEKNLAPMLKSAGLREDPDVLDTWFSSALWPHSTLGWPDPATAPTADGETRLGADGDGPDSLQCYYPGSCLVTGRDIITLWVARMVLSGLYNLGDVPFTDVFLHATILDGKGVRMSKSKGNGIDPNDIIARYGADALRFVICELQTGTQDVRLPVFADSPFTDQPIDLSKAKHGRSIETYLCPETGKEFDVTGNMAKAGVPRADTYSERFEVGRNFCNKLWNAARFAMLNLESVPFEQRTFADLPAEDRWVLSRLQHAIQTVQTRLEQYNPSAAIAAARDFFWSELCDWYLELIKPRMRDDARAPLARQVLATVLDQTLRLLHPFVPFITEALWPTLREQAPIRGIDVALHETELLVHAQWPTARAEWRDESLERRFASIQELTTAIREVRARYQVPPREQVEVRIKATGDDASAITEMSDLLAASINASSLTVAADAQKTKDSAAAVVRDVEAFVLGVVDLEKEKVKLEKERDKLTKSIAGAERKLQNEKFVAKAPPEVVQKERDELERMQRQLASVESGLADLG